MHNYESKSKYVSTICTATRLDRDPNSFEVVYINNGGEIQCFNYFYRYTFKNEKSRMQANWSNICSNYKPINY